MPRKGERQTLMFSSTFPEAIQQMAWDFLNDYLFLSVELSKNIKHNIIEVGEYEKREKLQEILMSCGK